MKYLEKFPSSIGVLTDTKHTDKDFQALSSDEVSRRSQAQAMKVAPRHQMRPATVT